MSGGDDLASRNRIREALDVSLIVEAAAGTGKTTEMIQRIVGVLGTGRGTIDKLAAVTFTRKAAGELKLRLRQELDRKRTDATGRKKQRLEDAVVRLEEARIGTIHAFCSDILRERPVEAGLTPDFGELDEKEARNLFERVFNQWAERVMNAPAPGLRRALERVAIRSSREPALEGIRREAWKIIEWRDFPLAWQKAPFDRNREVDDLARLASKLAAMARSSAKAQDALRQALAPVVAFSAGLERREAVRGRDHDSLEAALIALLGELRQDRRKGRGSFSDAVSRTEVLAARGQLLGRLEHFRVASEADLAAGLREELDALIPLYEEAKRRVGKLDFTDLLITTRNLLRDVRSAREHFQQRFTHVFVDEFQDTDPLQAEILLLLSSDDPGIRDARQVTPVSGKLFLVGDPKQSIYRFRRADFALYRSLRDSLTTRGVELVRLRRSFRSVPDIQRAINHAFAREMSDDQSAAQSAYAPLEEVSRAIPGQPALVALSLAKPYGRNRVTRTALNACLPDTTGAWIDWLLSESGWRVRAPGGELVPVAPRHVALLFRRFMSWGMDVTREYVHALEARNIPHLLWGARSFHQREEVETLRTALSAIEWPDDELSVFATLKGSLFAVGDDALLRYKTAAGTLHPFAPGIEGADESVRPVADALEVLRELHRRRNHRPFVETIGKLLAASRAHAGFALRPAGNQVLANVYRVSDLARRYEARGGTSFRGFVEELRNEARSGESSEAPALEEGAEGVRIMTVHAAKGLEFPIVILADITANLAPATPDKHVDSERGLAATRLLGCSPLELNEHAKEEHLRDESEGVRIAYVAATRARDVLVLPTVGDGPLDGWTSPLNRAFYPARDAPSPDGTAEGCPSFGDETVLDRPPQALGEAEHSVRPGAHRPGSGDYEVVWWDPSILKLDQKAQFGILQEQMLRADDPHGNAARSMDEYRAWLEARAALIGKGSVETLDVFSPSDVDAPEPDTVEAPEIVLLPRAPDRPSGPRFGTLVHAILRDVAFTASLEDIGALARFHGRILAAPKEEESAASGAVQRALEHPLLRRAASAPVCYREYPVTHALRSGRALDGVIDLAFEVDGTWHVVDFKTDADLAPRQAHYRKQIAWYVLALNRCFGKPTRGHLLGL